MKRRNFFKNQQTKHWQENVYQNPYFSKSKHDWKKIFITVSCISVALCVTAFFLYAPFLRVNTYAIDGLEFINEEGMRSKTESFFERKKFWIIPQDHFLFMPEEEAVQFLFERFQLDSLQITRDGGTVHVSVSEKICRAIWETNGEQYLIDETGTVLSKIDIPSDQLVSENGFDAKPKLAVIKSLENEGVVVGQKVLDSEIVTNILDILSQFRNGPFAVSSLEIDSMKSNFLKVNMEDGYAVFFDPTVDMTRQLEQLVTVLKGESADTSTYEYIDVRFGERVYIKDKI